MKLKKGYTQMQGNARAHRRYKKRTVKRTTTHSKTASRRRVKRTTKRGGWPKWVKNCWPGQSCRATEPEIPSTGPVPMVVVSPPTHPSTRPSRALPPLHPAAGISSPVSTSPVVTSPSTPPTGLPRRRVRRSAAHIAAGVLPPTSPHPGAAARPSRARELSAYRNLIVTKRALNGVYNRVTSTIKALGLSLANVVHAETLRLMLSSHQEFDKITTEFRNTGREPDDETRTRLKATFIQLNADLESVKSMTLDPLVKNLSDADRPSYMQNLMSEKLAPRADLSTDEVNQKLAEIQEELRVERKQAAEAATAAAAESRKRRMPL